MDHLPLDLLSHIAAEKIPDTLWHKIDNRLQKKKSMMIPTWMRIAALLFVAFMVGELIIGFRLYKIKSAQPLQHYSMYSTQQWYND